jgi:hypothetical protein
VNTFLTPIRTRGNILSEADMQSVFGNIETIHSFSSRLLGSLREKVGDVML